MRLPWDVRHVRHVRRVRGMSKLVELVQATRAVADGGYATASGWTTDDECAAHGLSELRDAARGVADREATARRDAVEDVHGYGAR